MSVGLTSKRTNNGPRVTCVITNRIYCDHQLVSAQATVAIYVNIRKSCCAIGLNLNLGGLTITICIRSEKRWSIAAEVLCRYCKNTSAAVVDGVRIANLFIINSLQLVCLALLERVAIFQLSIHRTHQLKDSVE